MSVPPLVGDALADARTTRTTATVGPSAISTSLRGTCRTSFWQPVADEPVSPDARMRSVKR